MNIRIPPAIRTAGIPIPNAASTERPTRAKKASTRKAIATARRIMAARRRGEIFRSTWLQRLQPFPRTRELIERFRADGFALAVSHAAEKLQRFEKVRLRLIQVPRVAVATRQYVVDAGEVAGGHGIRGHGPPAEGDSLGIAILPIVHPGLPAQCLS